ncbi:Uncharacterised protein [Streptococcus salivarius]|nr:Uncharacterised protein [Streptococcus salivarius]
MATREEWVRHFEDVNGRKPSPEEFMEAKKESFVIASEEPSVQVSKCLSRLRLSRWIALKLLKRCQLTQ